MKDPGLRQPSYARIESVQPLFQSVLHKMLGVSNDTNMPVSSWKLFQKHVEIPTLSNSVRIQTHFKQKR